MPQTNNFRCGEPYKIGVAENVPIINCEIFSNAPTEDMFETMDSAKGIGLAAPQIGKNIRIIVVDSKKMSEDFDEPGLDEFRKVFINPIIEQEFGDDFTFREGCLSLPRISEEITRKSKIILTYYDADWNLQQEEFSGLKARIIQHEYDHLEGIMWIDRASPLRRKLLQSKLLKISKGEVYHDYLMKFAKKKQ
jgi:peptide deformylase